MGGGGRMEEIENEGLWPGHAVIVTGREGFCADCGMCAHTRGELNNLQAMFTYMYLNQGAQQLMGPIKRVSSTTVRAGRMLAAMLQFCGLSPCIPIWAHALA